MVGDSYSDFVHKLEFEVSKGRITQVLHQVSAILWLLAPGQAFGWLIIRQSSPVHHFPASQCLKNATLTAKCCATVDSRRSSPHVHKIAFVWGFNKAGARRYWTSWKIWFCYEDHEQAAQRVMKVWAVRTFPAWFPEGTGKQTQKCGSPPRLWGTRQGGAPKRVLLASKRKYTSAGCCCRNTPGRGKVWWFKKKLHHVLFSAKHSRKRPDIQYLRSLQMDVRHPVI